MDFDNYTIRPLERADLAAYFQLVETNRTRLEDFFTGTVSRTRTLEETKAFIDEILEKSARKLYFPYLLINKADDSVIGFFDIKNIDWSIPKAELGCYIDKSYAGQGLATKAFKVFTDFCFAEFGFIKLFLRTHESNVPAQKIAKKCGFEIEGTIRKDYKTTSGVVVDLIYYGKLSYNTNSGYNTNHG